MRLYFPQWQGSGVEIAVRDGATSLKSYIEVLYDFLFEELEIESAIPDKNQEILGLEDIKRNFQKLDGLLQREKPTELYTVAGGCEVEIPVVSYLSRKYEKLSVIWFDAHGDLNSPSSSPSKALHGMPLRFLLDSTVSIEGPFPYKATLSPEQVLLVGIRDLDPPEEHYIEKSGIRTVLPEQVETQITEVLFTEAISQSEAVYVHLDLDVLATEEFDGVVCPTPGGLSVSKLLSMLDYVAMENRVAGMSLVENTETDREKLKKLDPLLSFFNKVSS
jgi:arginase